MILYLGPISSSVRFLMAREAVLLTEMPIDVPFIDRHRPDFLVSYNYRHKIPADVLAHFPGKAINCHIAYLPYNRGAHPNFWSWVDDTLKGVTIHLIDDDWDTGDILVQELVPLSEKESFASTYHELHRNLSRLLELNWPALRRGDVSPYRQTLKTPLHRTADIEPYRKYMPQGWDSRIDETLERIQADKPDIEESAQFWAQPDS